MPNNWTDISGDFINNNELELLTNRDAIKQSLKNMTLLELYDKPYSPELSSGLTNALFEHLNNAFIETIRQRIKNLLDTYEPRVVIKNIAIKKNSETSINITINYSFEGNIDSTSLDFSK